jgi:hypothetical protein
MSELQTEIVNISDDALDELFNDTPEKTVNADTLLGAKQNSSAEIENVDLDDEEEVEEEKPSKKAKTPPAKPQAREDVIEDLSDEDLEDKEVEDEDEDEKEEEDKPKKAKKEKAEAAPKEEETESNADVKSVLKSTVDYLVQTGAWADFDGREEMDIDEETYAKLVAEQDKHRVQTMFSELVDSTGPFGKAIIDYVKNGGNPDEIIDLFKEQKSVDSINIEEADGQKELVKHYYTEVMGWKPEKADKYIANLAISGELGPEAQEVKDLFKSYYEKEATRLNKEQDAFKQQQIEAEKAFEENIRTTVRTRKDLTPAEKKMIEDYALSYDQRLPNGQMVNKFYVNFAKMQSNPEDYIDLMLFVMDKQKYNQKIATKEKTQATAEAFKFIKGNGAVSTKKGTSYDSIKKNEKVSGFDWGFPSKK